MSAAPGKRPAPLRVTTANARFQEWEALLHNRSKRSRSGGLLVQGVRPLTVAIESGLQVREWLRSDGVRTTDWANGLIAAAPAPVYTVAAELMRTLGEQDERTPELLAVLRHPSDDLGRITVDQDVLGVVLDRPASPGNIGAVVRSVDALGGRAAVVCGHGADPYSPQAVRASTGSVFAVPTVRIDSPARVLEWVTSVRERGVPLRLLALDEDGDIGPAETDLRGPTLLLTGTEGARLSRFWREQCDQVVSIPMTGSASSLNAAVATSIVLYEADRQRRSNAAVAEPS